MLNSAATPLTSGSHAASAAHSHSQPTSPTFSSPSLLTTRLLSPTTAAVAAALNTDTNSKQGDTEPNYAPNSARDFAPFFDTSLPLHRVLYHLEALSSKLMPVNADFQQTSAEKQCTALFHHDFLKANGLEVLITLLQLENYSKDSQQRCVIAYFFLNSIT